MVNLTKTDVGPQLTSGLPTTPLSIGIALTRAKPQRNNPRITFIFLWKFGENNTQDQTGTKDMSGLKTERQVRMIWH